ncbi:overexpressed in colon carcinoma 1 protein isoform X3 [Manis javanica]|uniref:overexpressed in colon carcinoma 1 protein isoform X3 n=1 Tax=Manis javanica TaxID=9974 RepID=UPI003C6D4762
MPSRGARRRLRIGRPRGCRGDGWVWRGPHGWGWWFGEAGGFRPGAPRPSPRGGGKGGPRAPPLASRRGAPPSASVSAPRTCGRRLRARLPCLRRDGLRELHRRQRGSRPRGRPPGEPLESCPQLYPQPLDLYPNFQENFLAPKSCFVERMSILGKQRRYKSKPQIVWASCA